MTKDMAELYPEQIFPKQIFMSSEWLVVSKPSGWLTIPGRQMGENSPPILSEWAKKEFSSIWVVHRLDLETSGVVLFARTSQSHQLANTWFQQRKMKKVYSCISSGVPRMPVFKVQEPIAGMSSITQVEVKESFQEGFLAQVSPYTGRRHQIRIHLSKQGLPIWGDSTYGGAKEIQLGTFNLPVSRVALHASQLKLPTGEVFKSEFPQDFENWLTALRERGQSVTSK